MPTLKIEKPMHVVATKIRRVFQGKDSASATFQGLLSGLFFLIISVGTGVTTARFLGAAGRGELAAIITYSGVLSTLMTFGLRSSLIYQLKRNPEEKSKLFSAALIMGSVMSLTAITVGVVFTPYWLSNYSPEVVRTAQWFMLMIPFNILSMSLTAVLEAQEEFNFTNQTRYLCPLATLVILVLLIVFKALTPATAALAYILPSIPPSLWLLPYLWRSLKPQRRKLGTSFKRLLHYGFRCYGIDVLRVSSGQIDQILVVSLLSPNAVGIYVVALSSVSLLPVLREAIVTVLFPKVAACPVSEIITHVGRTARLSMLLVSLAGGCLIVLAPFLLNLLYGSAFLEAVGIVRVLTVEAIFSVVTWILAQTFMATGRPGVATALQVIGVGISTPLMLLLIPKQGVMGAAIALLSATIVRLVLALAAYPVLLKVKPPSLLINRQDLLYLYQRLV
jgi:O-antigen/teichoic acid export membrane protein